MIEKRKYVLIKRLKSYVGVSMMDEGIKGWKQFSYGINMWRGIFVATEIHNYPRHVTKEANWYRVRHKTQ